VVLILALIVFAQVGNPIVQQPAPSPPNQTINVTNVFPPPDPALVIETERQAAPAILESGFEALTRDGAARTIGFLNVGGNFGLIRRAIIEQPRVLDVAHTGQRLVLASLGLALAALALWGLIGHFVGSDAHEAFEAIGHLPLWALAALSTIAWYGLLLTMFEAIGGALSNTAVEVLGAPLGACPEIGPCQNALTAAAMGVFGLLMTFLYILAVLFFGFQMWLNTAFLAFAGAVAPPFVFSMATPWTKRWGHNWFRMVPGTLGDLVAMSVVLVLGGPTLEQLGSNEPFNQIALRIALLLVLGMVRHLFGLDQSSAGGRMFSALLLARALRRGGGGAATTAPAATSSSPPSPASPARAPRWGSSGWGPATNKMA